MASACVNRVGVPPGKFHCSPSYGWLSPRASFKAEKTADRPEDAGDFEFRLDDPVVMLSADELFSDGKLVPLQVATVPPVKAEDSSPEEDVKLPEVSVNADPCLFSPKAPKCASNWREFLGLKKLYQNSKTTSALNASTTASASSNGGRSIRHLLHRSSKSASAADASLSLPLLKDSECESISISAARLSLSSISSGLDRDDLPRFSLDSNIRPCRSQLSASRSSSGVNQGQIHQRARMPKPMMVPSSIAEDPKPLIDHPSAPAPINRVGRSTMRRADQDPTLIVTRGFSVDSPRLSSSGKIVYQGLERSSSSPSTFNGGPRYNKHMERSYSSNVRVTPVLNVPVCSLRGSSKFALFSTPSQKKDINNGGTSAKRTTTRTRRESSN